MTRPKAIQSIAKTQEKYKRWMIYGYPGAGKTVLAGGSPRGLIIVNNASEILSSKAFGSTCDFVVAENFQEVAELYEYLRNEGFKEYDWVWLDNLTLMQDQNMDLIMAELKRRKPERNQFVPDQHEYLMNQNMLATTVRDFITLPMHVGLTAHCMKAEDEEGNVLYLPMIQGGKGDLSQKICGYMNLVGYMHAFRKDGKQQRKLLVEKRSKYHAKGRYPGMNGEITNPDMGLLLKATDATVPTSTGSTTRKRRPVNG